MKRLRPVETETCCICGEQFDKIKMRDFSIGRSTKWMCLECYAGANREIETRQSAWKRSSKGKQVISDFNKRK